MSTKDTPTPLRVEEFIAVLDSEAVNVQDVTAYITGNGSNQDEERKARKRVIIEDAARFLTEHQDKDHPYQLLSDHLYPQLHKNNIYSPESEELGRVLWLLDHHKAIAFRGHNKD